MIELLRDKAAQTQNPYAIFDPLLPRIVYVAWIFDFLRLPMEYFNLNNTLVKVFYGLPLSTSQNCNSNDGSKKRTTCCTFA